MTLEVVDGKLMKILKCKLCDRMIKIDCDPRKDLEMLAFRIYTNSTTYEAVDLCPECYEKHFYSSTGRGGQERMRKFLTVDFKDKFRLFVAAALLFGATEARAQNALEYLGSKFSPDPCYWLPEAKPCVDKWSGFTPGAPTGEFLYSYDGEEDESNYRPNIREHKGTYPHQTIGRRKTTSQRRFFSLPPFKAQTRTKERRGK